MTYRADIDVVMITAPDGDVFTADYSPVYDEHLARGDDGWGYVYVLVPACRCYRCGVLLTFEKLTVDRIVPGCKGGTYRRTNIRPACVDCNRETGQGLR